MPVNQVWVYIVNFVCVCMQLQERIILNLEMAYGNSNFNSALKESLLKLGPLGTSRVLSFE